MARAMWVIGLTTKCMVEESYIGLMGNAMRENLKVTSDMVKASSIGQMVGK